MKLIHKTIHIGKMTCINCQNKIEQALSDLPGVRDVSVSYKNGTACFTYDSDRISLRKIEQEIEKLNYEVLPDAERPDLCKAICLLAIIIALYVLLQQLGFLNLLVPSRLANNRMGYGMMFVAGLLTSVHCIAMCGGINLSQCLPKSKGVDSKVKSPFLPSALYNFGRMISYTVIGFLSGLIGLLLGSGSGAENPVLIQGILKLIAGTVMVVMGINMLGIFPWLRRLSLRMPKVLSKTTGRKKAAERRPFIVGLLNGLMPCGPLQSMQILALASGNPLTGALSMLLFSLGTVPLMLGLGTLVSALGRKFAHAVTSVGAVLVAVLGLAMLSQGGSLSGMLLPDRLLFFIIGLTVIGIVASIPVTRKSYRIACIAVSFAVVFTVGIVRQHLDRETAVPNDSDVRIVDGVQMVDSTLSTGRYPTITVQANMPVKWTIHAPEGSVNGCNYRIIIQPYGIEYSFEEGDNVIEFTPTDSGMVSYTCWMGMIRGNIIVTE